MFRQASETEADSAVVLDIARDGREAGQLRLSLAPNQRCVFGRQPGGCDVVLEHLSISRQHAHLSMDLNGRCFVTDMGSGVAGFHHCILTGRAYYSCCFSDMATCLVLLHSHNTTVPGNLPEASAGAVCSCIGMWWQNTYASCCAHAPLQFICLYMDMPCNIQPPLNFATLHTNDCKPVCQHWAYTTAWWQACQLWDAQM